MNQFLVRNCTFAYASNMVGMVKCITRPVSLVWMVLFLSAWSISTIGFFSVWISSDLNLPGPISISNPEIALNKPTGGAEPFQSVMTNTPGCTTLEAYEITFTLVMQLSEERLWMMKHHCERWGEHPISIAIHTKRKLLDVVNDMVGMGCSQKHIIINVMYEYGDYPINHLRNLAISSIQTTHCLYVDVDFWPSKDLYTTLSMQIVRDTLVEDDKLALVIPAFQITRKGPGCENSNSSECDALNAARMAKDRLSLYKLIRSRDAHMFDPTNPRGHHSTGYREWITQQQLRDIDCIESNRYEPYLAFRFCGDIPPFQERFAGYGKNKLTWAMHMRRVGYRFKVIADGFVLHFPHTDSDARKSWNLRPDRLNYYMKPGEVAGVDWKIYKRGAVDALYSEFKTWLMNETADKSRVPMCYESDDDNSNLWMDPSKK